MAENVCAKCGDPARVWVASAKEGPMHLCRPCYVARLRKQQRTVRQNIGG